MVGSFGRAIGLNYCAANISNPFINELSTYFDGTSDLVDFGIIHPFNYLVAHSFSFWIYVPAGSSDGIIIGKENSGTPYGYSVGAKYMTATGYSINFEQINYYPNYWNNQYTSTELLFDRWYHCVVVWDGLSGNASNGHFYIDGVPVASTVSANTLGARTFNNTTAKFYLGGRQFSNNSYVGYLDEVTVWNKALSAAEAAELYNGGVPFDVSTASCYANCLSWWRMGDGDTYPIILDHGPNSYHGTMVGMSAASFVEDVP